MLSSLTITKQWTKGEKQQKATNIKTEKQNKLLTLRPCNGLSWRRNTHRNFSFRRSIGLSGKKHQTQKTDKGCLNKNKENEKNTKLLKVKLLVTGGLILCYISEYLSSGKFVLRRYVFDASTLSTLKAQSSSFRVSRENVVTAVIWQCFMEAVTEESAGKDMNPILMTQAVNLRRKATPPFPDDSFGNLVWSTKSLWSNPNEKDLMELLRDVKKGIAKIDGEFVRRLGNDGVSDFLEELRNEMPQEATLLGFTSWANIGLSEIDFGGGKPV